MPGAPARAQFASGVDLVEVYATVTGRDGAPIADLAADDVVVDEDGVPQRVVAFAGGAVPLAVAVAIDRSFSMRGAKLAAARTAAVALVDALAPDDQLMVVAVGSRVEPIVPLDTNRRAARDAIASLDCFGTTALHDATLEALAAIDAAHGRRVLVLLSDGVDRYSRAGADQVLDAVRRRNVIVYPLAVGRSMPPLFPRAAAASGGRAFASTDARELAREARRIAADLRAQYLVGYAPSRPVRPGWHAVSVRVNRPGANVRTREGYYVR